MPKKQTTPAQSASPAETKNKTRKSSCKACKSDATEIAYFAASNSGYGFKNYYDDIFLSHPRRYIIKGGPGTGKSGLMKRAAAEGEARGWRCERFYCSSDPASLDGVILYPSDGGESICVIDGTPPHAAEPIYPGARDEILNLGAFWNGAALRRESGLIRELCDKKSALFVGAYHYLAAAERVENEVKQLVFSAILEDKLAGAVSRLSKRIRSLEPISDALIPHENDAVRLIDGIGMDGIKTLDTLASPKDIAHRFVLRDRVGIGSEVLRLLYLAALGEGERVIRVPDPLSPKQLRAIVFPKRGAAVIPETRFDGTPMIAADGDESTVINTERFIDRELLARSRVKQRFGRKCRDALLEGALGVFSDIRSVHFEIEAIYGAAMDFAAVDEYIEAFIGEIFTDVKV